MSERVAQERRLTAEWDVPLTVVRVAKFSRQAIHPQPNRRPAAAGPGMSRPGDDGIVEIAEANPGDGTRMFAALTRSELSEIVNRSRVQQFVIVHRLLQPTRGVGCHRRSGVLSAHSSRRSVALNMTKVWTAARCCAYLHVIVDYCTRGVTGWTIDFRTRSAEAVARVEAALLERRVPTAVSTIGTDNCSEFTSRDSHRHLSARGVSHRCGGHSDHEYQAFIKSWFSQFKKRCVWRVPWETIDQARTEFTSFLDHCHHRPHSEIVYRTRRGRPDPGGGYKPRQPELTTQAGPKSP